MKEKRLTEIEIYENLYYKEMKELTQRKKIYKKELSEELTYIYSINNDDIMFTIFKEKFIKLIKDFYNSIDNLPNTLSLSANYFAYRHEYLNLTSQYLHYHQEVSKITFLDDNKKIKFDNKITLKEVRLQMEKIINDIFEEQLNKYKHIKNYELIEDKLLEIKSIYVDICLSGYVDIETMITDFNKDINKLRIKSSLKRHTKTLIKKTV